jgi:hypothetical protein
MASLDELLQQLGFGGVTRNRAGQIVGNTNDVIPVATAGLADTLYGAGRGTLAGTAAIGGIPGDINQMYVNKFGALYPNEPAPPTSEQISRAVKRAVPPLNLSRDNTGRVATSLGENLVSPMVAPEALLSTGVKTAKYAAPVVGKAAENYAARTGLLIPLDAYHGSPSKFDKFDINKVGTGEGAQAYGYGMYFAERPGVASEYQKNLSQEYANQVAKGGIRNPEYRKVQADLLRFDRELQKKYQFEGISPNQEVIQYGETKFPKDVVERAKKLNNREQEIYDNLKKGYLYKTNIPDEAEKTFLDWDRPFNQQNEMVRRSLSSLHPEVKNKILAKDSGGNDPTGGLIYNRLQEYFSEGKRNDAFANKASYGAKIASEELNSINIKGIKYKDALSRDKEEGTRNYVVFDPSIVQILERNNQPIKGLLK